jgi:hypothetical protein
MCHSGGNAVLAEACSAEAISEPLDAARQQIGPNSFTWPSSEVLCYSPLQAKGPPRYGMEARGDGEQTWGTVLGRIGS